MSPAPKPPDEAMSTRVQFLCTKDERDSYEAAADKAERNLSDWIRRTLRKAAV